MSLNDFLIAQVTDPTDFAPSLPLQRMDGALRCTVCKEFFDAPVITPCAHTFCSLCVRTYLSTKTECPVCRSQLNEGQLQPNTTLEDVVAIWKQQARAEVLDITQREASSSSSKKRKAAFCADDAPGPPKRVKSDELNSTIPASVECPICSKNVLPDKINEHMDSGCADFFASRPPPSKTQRGSSGSSSKSGQTKTDVEQDPLPKVAYDTLKDKQLKERLSEHDLSIVGDRKTLVERHQQWVMLYNSNLDRASHHRCSVADLRKQLTKWEKEKNLANTKKRPVVDDIEAHKKKHRSHFDDLIASARPKKAGISTSKTAPSDVIVLDLDS
ncbi:hypothetical protein DL96DRAFT_1578830 [Flagelloscypha sp. PMI_526]|nr:hypothetical protein DL96DRAFT_1578830 [Flagelloscypha sp. PMI_526]